MKVKRPENTLIVPVKGIRYVYITLEKIYKKDKKYNVNKRKCVGRMEDDIYMIPNDQFFEYFPECVELEESPECSDVLKIGTHIAFDKIMKDLKLDSLLEEVYARDAGMIKDVMSYMIVSEDSVMQHFPSYEFEHPVFMEKRVEDSAVCEMFKRHSITEHDRFLDSWNEMHTDTEGIYISYDSTNMNSAAAGIELLEFGHSKDENSDLPQVNVSLAFDQTNSIPLFYETYPGSIIDNSQCKVMVDRAKKYGYGKISFILDRGYFSVDNIKYFDKNGYGFLMMTKGNAQFIRKSVDKVKQSLRMNSKYYIPECELQGTTLKQKLFDGDTECRYIHVYYDDVKGAEQRRAVMKRFALFDKELAKLCEKKLTKRFNVKKFEKYYRLKFIDDYLVSFSRKDKEIEKEMEYCGYFTLISSEKMTAETALEKYRNRDSTEKQFLTEKSFLGGDTWRVYTDVSFESKQLESFLALIVRNELFKSMSELRTKDKKRYTVPAALRELDRIIITRDSKGRFALRYALTAAQKNILKTIGIDEDDVKVYAKKISEKYSI